MRMKTSLLLLVVASSSGCVSSVDMGTPMPAPPRIVSHADIAGTFENRGTCSRSAAYPHLNSWLEGLLLPDKPSGPRADSVVIRFGADLIFIDGMLDGKVIATRALKQGVDYALTDSGIQLFLTSHRVWVEDSAFTQSKDQMYLWLSAKGSLIVEYWQDISGVGAVVIPVPYHSRKRFWFEFKNRANKSLQPTATAVTPPAAQEIVPAVAVAEH
jgi:hypothetical protein